MALLLPAIISSSSRTQQPLLILQSSLVQSSLPILRSILSSASSASSPSTRKNKPRTLLFCFLYPPNSLLSPASGELSESESIQVFDRTACVPGYDDEYTDPGEFIINALKAAPPGPLNVVIDSIDTISADIGSPSKTYTTVSSILAILRSRPSSSLIIHILASSNNTSSISTATPTNLLSLLLSPRLSSSLTHLTAHPPSLITHIASTHLTVLPPATSKDADKDGGAVNVARWWQVFGPMTEVGRSWEVERVVLGADGVGLGGSVSEVSGPAKSNGTRNVKEDGEAGAQDIVVEVLVRGSAASAHGTRRSVERVLEGWSSKLGPCEMNDLGSLKGIWTRRGVAPGGDAQTSSNDPTHPLSFNLSLTAEQQQARAGVPLPYVHEGQPLQAQTNAPSSAGAIFYDPDSADDIDDDDPDEDLDI